MWQRKKQDLTPNDLLKDPSTPFWMKEVLQKLLSIDPVDATNGVYILFCALSTHSKQAISKQRKQGPSRS